MNRVVIIDGDHHNTLGLVRAFGKNAICYYFTSEEDDINIYRLNMQKTERKLLFFRQVTGLPVNLTEGLMSYHGLFILPSINQRPRAIEYFMDKKTQAEFAESRNIPIAKTQEVKLSPHSPENPIGQYPRIIKPIISAFGSKGDITVVRNPDEYNTALQDFAEKGYQSVLVQEYLDIDYEIVCFGAVLHQESTFCFAAVHIIRFWPKKGGTCSYFQILLGCFLYNYM